MEEFGNQYSGQDPIKFWSKVDFLLISLSILSFFNIGFLSFLISGFLDLFLVYTLKRSFIKYNIKAKYNLVESAGKQLVFMVAYSLILGFFIYKFAQDTSDLWLYSIVGSIIVYILIRLFINIEIVNSAVKWNMNPEEKIFKDYIHMEKYIRDDHEGVGPVYALRNKTYEVERCHIKYKGRIYNMWSIYEYLSKNNKKIEELTDEEMLNYIQK